MFVKHIYLNNNYKILSKNALIIVFEILAIK